VGHHAQRGGASSSPDTADRYRDNVAPHQSQRPRLRLREQLPISAAVGVGGALGAAGRFGAHRLWPNSRGAFPWTALWINVLGCFLMGILMIAFKELFPRAPKLLSPMLTTGMLGGFTSFSTYTNDTRDLYDRGSYGYGTQNLILTVVLCMAAVALGAAGTHALLRRRGGD